MARILVQTPLKRKKFRMWCTTIDQWVTPSMNEGEMLHHLQTCPYEKHTKKQAFRRCFRIDYAADHKVWLKENYDDCYQQLCRIDRRNRK